VWGLAQAYVSVDGTWMQLLFEYKSWWQNSWLLTLHMLGKAPVSDEHQHPVVWPFGAVLQLSWAHSHMSLHCQAVLKMPEMTQPSEGLQYNCLAMR